MSSLSLSLSIYLSIYSLKSLYETKKYLRNRNQKKTDFFFDMIQCLVFVDALCIREEVRFIENAGFLYLSIYL